MNNIRIGYEGDDFVKLNLSAIIKIKFKQPEEMTIENVRTAIVDELKKLAEEISKVEIKPEAFESTITGPIIHDAGLFDRGVMFMSTPKEIPVLRTGNKTLE